MLIDIVDGDGNKEKTLCEKVTDYAGYYKLFSWRRIFSASSCFRLVVPGQRQCFNVSFLTSDVNLKYMHLLFSDERSVELKVISLLMLDS